MTDTVATKESSAAAVAKAVPATSVAVKIEGFDNASRSPIQDGFVEPFKAADFLVVGQARSSFTYDVLHSFSFSTAEAVVDYLQRAGYRSKHIVSLPAEKGYSPWSYFEKYVLPFMHCPWNGNSIFSDNLDRWIESFPIPSKKVPGLVAYFQDADKRARDIQTPIKPGKYLKKFFGDLLSEETIQALALEWTNAYSPRTLNVTQDADEIERIYRGKYNGSCMHFRHGDHSGDEHPARVYAGPDLGIAYIGDIDSADGRCLVWPDKKIYFGKFYGDYHRLEASLIAAGYSEGEEEEFSGARLQRIPYGSSFVLPYIDTHESVRDNGTWLILDNDGDIGARNTNGLSDELSHCDDCEETTDSDDLTYIGSLDRSVCSCCRAENYFYCDEMHDYYRDEDGVEVEGMGTYSQRGVDRMVDRETVFFCEETEEYYSASSYDHTVLTDGRTVALHIAEERGYFCAFSDQYSLDHGTKQEISDGRYVDLDMVSNTAELDAWCDGEGVTLVGAIKDENQIELALAA